MSSEELAVRMRELEEALECGGRITSDAARILSDCSTTLGVYSSKTAPIRDRARTLTIASRNIRQARERCDQIATSLDMSRRLQVAATCSTLARWLTVVQYRAPYKEALGKTWKLFSRPSMNWKVMFLTPQRINPIKVWDLCSGEFGPVVESDAEQCQRSHSSFGEALERCHERL